MKGNLPQVNEANALFYLRGHVIFMLQSMYHVSYRPNMNNYTISAEVVTLSNYVDQITK